VAAKNQGVFFLKCHAEFVKLSRKVGKFGERLTADGGRWTVDG
jgi:hypothetical protein